MIGRDTGLDHNGIPIFREVQKFRPIDPEPAVEAGAEADRASGYTAYPLRCDPTRGSSRPRRPTSRHGLAAHGLRRTAQTHRRVDGPRGVATTRRRSTFR